MNGIYTEKRSGKVFKRIGWSNNNGHPTVTLREYDGDERIDISEDDLDNRFNFEPFKDAIVSVEDVKPMYPIHIVLKCPECGSPLVWNGETLLSYPPQFRHKCSNKNCKYETTTRSIHTDMYVIVNKELEKKIKNGTYDAVLDGRLIEVKEEILWDFK